ncbi:unnamed protein product [Ilex paraguariensis]|uniref:Pseudouridine synthase family protein n=1 Tax=Ilex paraguariensis TaxID=185542 RepID=A0ABC8SWT7_9AQUA
MFAYLDWHTGLRAQLPNSPNRHLESPTHPNWRPGPHAQLPDRPVASRRSSEELIFGGTVAVNGSLCNIPQTKVDPARDMIYVNGNRLPKKLPPKVYLALNKPKGYICSSGEKETKPVISLFEELGIDDLLRLSSFGMTHYCCFICLFNHRHDNNNVLMLHLLLNDLRLHIFGCRYIATIDGLVNKRHLIAISEGTVIEGVHCTPDVVELLPRQPDVSRP